MIIRRFNVAFKSIVLFMGCLVAACSGSATATVEPEPVNEIVPSTSLSKVIPDPADEIVPFINIAREALGDNAFVDNWHP